MKILYCWQIYEATAGIDRSMLSLQPTASSRLAAAVSVNFSSMIVDIMIYIMDKAFKKRSAVRKHCHRRTPGVRMCQHAMGGTPA
jgi:hypothetical protein